MKLAPKVSLIIVKIFIYHQSLKLENLFPKDYRGAFSQILCQNEQSPGVRQKQTLQEKNSRFEVSLLLEALCEE